MISWEDFEKIDIRIGTIVEAHIFEKARKPAYKLLIDFGEEGSKWSSAQITEMYSVEDLKGKQIAAVINFPEKNIAGFKSQCLVLGIYNVKGVVLLQPESIVKNGEKVG